MTEVYLHVGLPKTGTTFLQKRCFPYLKGVHYVGKEHRAPATGLLDGIWRLAEGYPLFADVAKHRDEVDRHLRTVAEDKLLISYERLVGDVFWAFRDHVPVTESLQALFPSARIILTIRRQDDLLESLYRERLRSYYYPTVDGFLGYQDGRFADRFRPPLGFPTMNVWRFDHHAYARNYAKTFGRENVLVLPLELLSADPERYHLQIAGFLGIDPYRPADGMPVNRGYSVASARVALLLNRFVRAPWRERRVSRFIPVAAARYVLDVVDRLPAPRGNLLGAERRRMIMEVHRASNRALDAEHGLDLGTYGYY